MKRLLALALALAASAAFAAGTMQDLRISQDSGGKPVWKGTPWVTAILPNCSTSQIPKWDGNSWECADDSGEGGHVTQEAFSNYTTDHRITSTEFAAVAFVNSTTHIVAGENITLTADSEANSLTIAAPMPEIFAATSSAASAAANTAAIQAAFDAGAGKRIIVSGGALSVNGGTLIVSNNCEIEFQGGTKWVVASTTSSHQVLTIGSAVTRCRIIAPEIDLNYNATTYQPQAIYVDGTANVTLESPRIYNSGVTRTWPVSTGWGYGVYLNGAWNHVVINNPVMYDLHYGIITNRNNSTGSGLWVYGGSLENMSGDGIEMDVPTTGTHDIYVDAVNFYRIGSNDPNKGMGFGASGAPGTTIYNVKVTNCTFAECDLQGVHIEDGVRDVLINDNYFYANGEGAAHSYGAAVSLSAGNAANRAISNITVSRNIVHGGSLSDYGIFVGGVYSNGIITVSENHVRGIGNGPGIQIGAVHTHVNVDRNIVSNSTGPGIVYTSAQGTLTGNVCFDDQGTKTQTYGIELGANGYGQVIRDNIISDNLNKGFYLNGVTFPKHVASETERLTGIAATASAWSAWTDMLYLGSAASGTIYLNHTYATAYGSGLYTFNWGGTTLTLTLLKITNSGGISIGTVAADALQMNGNWLQTRVYNGTGANLTTIVMEAAINGSILMK